MLRPVTLLFTLLLAASGAHAQEALQRFYKAQKALHGESGGQVAIGPCSLQSCPVTVTAKAGTGKRCEVSVSPTILLVDPANSPGDAITITFTLSTSGYAFDPDLSVDVVGDGSSEFDDPTTSPASVTVVNHRKTKKTAYGYNVFVGKVNAQGKYHRCGFIDPLIVNRD